MLIQHVFLICQLDWCLLYYYTCEYTCFWPPPQHVRRQRWASEPAAAPPSGPSHAERRASHNVLRFLLFFFFNSHVGFMDQHLSFGWHWLETASVLHVTQDGNRNSSEANVCNFPSYFWHFSPAVKQLSEFACFFFRWTSCPVFDSSQFGLLY